jgi:hypothetical protein
MEWLEMKKDEPTGPSYGQPSGLHFQMKNIHYLEVHPVHQNDVSANEHVRTVGWWRRQLPFEVWGAGKHFPPQLHRKYAAYHQPSFQFGRQAVPIPQAAGQVIVMRRVPAVHGVVFVVAVEMISVVTLAEFLSVAATIVVTSFLLGQS